MMKTNVTAKQLCMFLFTTVITLLLPHDAEARKRRKKIIEEPSFMEEYMVPFLKVSLACSPIIIIVGMLAFAREDEEEEKAKLELQKKSGCKP